MNDMPTSTVINAAARFEARRPRTLSEQEQRALKIRAAVERLVMR